MLGPEKLNSIRNMEHINTSGDKFPLKLQNQQIQNVIGLKGAEQDLTQLAECLPSLPETQIGSLAYHKQGVAATQ